MKNIKLPFNFQEQSIWKLLLALFAVELCFLLLNCFDLPAYILTRSFNLDGEANIPTWFSSMQLFVMGCVALLCWRMEGFKNEKIVIGWIVLTVIFWSLSLDEVATLHELTAKALAHRYDLRAFRIRGFVWVYMLAPFALVAAFYMAYFFYKRFSRVKRSLYLASIGLILWTLVLPLEYLGGRFADIHVEFWQNRVYRVMTNIEEISEMAGASLILASLLFYFNHVSTHRLCDDQSRG